MAIEVAKIVLMNVRDTSGLEACIAAGQFTADDVVAVVGKSEGNGGVNDFSRMVADDSFRRYLAHAGTRSTEAIADIPMAWSGGCDGILAPHATIFARTAAAGTSKEKRLALGTAISEEILPEDIGRPAMVEKVAAAVRIAMRDSGIESLDDVHFVQTKTPVLTADSVRDAERRGQTVACRIQESAGFANGTSALGVAVALGEVAMPRADQICQDMSLYSSVANCSSGVEVTRAQVVLLGNKEGAGGRYRIGHSVMKDLLDIDAVYAAIRSAGLDLPERARASDLGGRVVNCFIKCEPNSDGRLRGRRLVMFNDSDVSVHRHTKAAAGGMIAAAIGDSAVFISVDAKHSCPHGSGPVAAIIDTGVAG
jgi:ring-opening amidohydrolase-like protein